MIVFVSPGMLSAGPEEVSELVSTSIATGWRDVSGASSGVEPVSTVAQDTRIRTTISGKGFIARPCRGRGLFASITTLVPIVINDKSRCCSSGFLERETGLEPATLSLGS